MSLLKAIKAQLGLSNTPANNFTITAEADNGTLKLARGNAGATTQDILTVDAAGKVAFPQGTYAIPAGTIIDFAGTSAPTGFLACPTVPTNVSRTTYAALFNAIGTSWGAGDGSTTFGIPYFESGLPALQGTPGAKFAGAVQAHIHLISQPNGATSVGGVVYGNPGSTGGTNSASGDNMPAGRGVLKCVKV